MSMDQEKAALFVGKQVDIEHFAKRGSFYTNVLVANANRSSITIITAGRKPAVLFYDHIINIRFNEQGQQAEEEARRQATERENERIVSPEQWKIIFPEAIISRFPGACARPSKELWGCTLGIRVGEPIVCVGVSEHGTRTYSHAWCAEGKNRPLKSDVIAQAQIESHKTPL